MILQDWMAVISNLMLDYEELTTIDRFSYLGSCVTKDNSSVLENAFIQGSNGVLWTGALVTST